MRGLHIIYACIMGVPSVNFFWQVPSTKIMPILGIESEYLKISNICVLLVNHRLRSSVLYF